MYHLPLVIVKNDGSNDSRYDNVLTEFSRKRYCTGAVDALQLLEDAPAHMVIAETALPDMNAVEFAEVIRDIDSESGHFTYIVLTGDAIDNRIRDAFAESVDAFVTSVDDDRFLDIVRAGMRLSRDLNDLGENNARLLRERDILRAGQLLDPLTGLGNERRAEQALRDTIRQIESRGGAACYLLMTFDNRNEVIEAFDEHIADEVVIAIAQRLRHLVRPMDPISYLGDGRFAAVILLPSIEHCSPDSYGRIFDGIRLKSYRTAAGYIEVRIGMAMCASHADAGAPDPETMVHSAESHLKESVHKQQIIIEHLAE